MKWSEMSERAKDALIAEKVMRWKVQDTTMNAKGYIRYLEDWKPSTNIADAWRVAEKVKFAGPHKHISIGYQNGYWSCWIMGVCEEIATSATEAICIAALKACGVEIEQ